jgi:hypothetical protein
MSRRKDEEPSEEDAPADDASQTWESLGDMLRAANPGKFLVVFDIVRELVEAERHRASGRGGDEALLEN